jgi:uncharacterized membrane protein/thiol-disulfide isomerase/thioredoxin
VKSKAARALLTGILLAVFSIFSSRTVRAQGAVVRAVLFYSPTCGHCHYVITEVLPPLFDQYGSQLEVIGVDVTMPDGQVLFHSALQKFNLESGGVPFLVVGDTYLIGSVDIPEQFPSLIEYYLSQGSLDWPSIPGLAEALQITPQETLAPTQTYTPAPTAIPLPVVHAVLFYRSACSHCQQIVDEVLPSLFEQYGSQLAIFGLDVSLPEGDDLFDKAIAQYKIQNVGVPTIIVGNQALAGQIEIQEQFPELIERYLAQGGVDWPDLAGLEAARASVLPTATPESPYITPILGTASAGAAEPATSTATPGLVLAGGRPINGLDGFALDPLGSSLAVLILLGMLAVVVASVIALFLPEGVASAKPHWTIPILCILGLGVAGYLAYVEITLSTAICGPVGDCNTVQESEYARLFGILPIGVLGMGGYVLITIAWFFGRFSKAELADYARLAMLAMTLFGTLFSIYLTFLEPFVIGAVCAWCLTSSVLMTLLLLFSLGPGKAAARRFLPKLRSVQHNLP